MSLTITGWATSELPFLPHAIPISEKRNPYARTNEPYYRCEWGPGGLASADQRILGAFPPVTSVRRPATQITDDVENAAIRTPMPQNGPRGRVFQTPVVAAQREETKHHLRPGARVAYTLLFCSHSNAHRQGGYSNWQNSARTAHARTDVIALQVVAEPTNLAGHKG